nr:DUF4276 family protein [uncultured Rhodoferax sp.]
MTAPKRLIAIVEGEGDERAVPELLRRILHAHERFDVEVLRPQRRGDLPKVRANFSRFLQTAALEDAAILCLLDFDCADCVDVIRAEEDMRDQAKKIRPDQLFDACFIVKEFESLFLSDPNSTKVALPLIPNGLEFPVEPELIRDAKGWLSDAQPSGAAYKPTAHQAKITAHLDLHILSERSPSYRRLETAVLRLTK